MGIDFYAPGTYFDPRAPWNQSDGHEFDEEVYDIIDQEIDNNSYEWLEWLDEKIVEVKDNDDDVIRAIGEALSRVESVCEQYREYRYENVLQDYIEHMPEPPEYDED